MTLEQALDAFDRAASGLARWEAALADFAALTAARIGQICAIDRDGSLIVNISCGLSSDQIAEFITTEGTDPRVNARVRSILAAPLLRTIAEMPCSAVIKLHDDGQQTIFMTLFRAGEDGPMTDEQRQLIDRAAPRIRDAVIAGIARERQQIDLVCNTLDYLTTAVVALNAQGQIVALSPLAAAALDDGRHLTARKGSLLAHAAERQGALSDAVAATCRSVPPSERRGVSLIIPATGDGPIMIAEVAPLPLDTAGWLHTACCLIFLRSQAIARVDVARYLAHHHLLTPSECEIALHLVEGRDARGIASLRTVSEGTVRNQIKAVLAKTGYRRQIDLVSALRR